VDSLQPPFSLIHREAAAREIRWCAQHKTGVICYSPMQSGLLTDAFSKEHVAKFAADDWRPRSQSPT
jgi:aryl-alcohol dehydrogenase-like predicted oxidoreductase